MHRATADHPCVFPGASAILLTSVLQAIMVAAGTRTTLSTAKLRPTLPARTTSKNTRCPLLHLSAHLNTFELQIFSLPHVSSHQMKSVICAVANGCCCFLLPQCSAYHHVMLQKKTAQGRDPDSTPLHVCQCPNCFTAFSTPSGIECRPKCDLATCDEDTGVCNSAGGKGTLAAGFQPFQHFSALHPFCCVYSWSHDLCGILAVACLVLDPSHHARPWMMLACF